MSLDADSPKMTFRIRLDPQSLLQIREPVQGRKTILYITVEQQGGERILQPFLKEGDRAVLAIREVEPAGFTASTFCITVD